MSTDDATYPGATNVCAAAGDDVSADAPQPEASASQVIPWLKPTVADLDGLDFEAPIAASDAATCDELSELYRRAAYLQEGQAHTPATRVFALLSAVTSMYLKAHEREEPFSPLMLASDRRTAIAADFRGAPVELLADMAVRSANPVLKARLADVCWLLERRRGPLASAAVAAYVDTIEAVELGSLKFRFANSDGALRTRRPRSSAARSGNRLVNRLG